MADIFCNVCNTNLGWKYEMAYEQSQKYKEGAHALVVALGCLLRACVYVCVCVCVCVCVWVRIRVCL